VRSFSGVAGLRRLDLFGDAGKKRPRGCGDYEVGSRAGGFNFAVTFWSLDLSFPLLRPSGGFCIVFALHGISQLPMRDLGGGELLLLLMVFLPPFQ